MNTFYYNINDAYYIFKRNNWMADPFFYLLKYNNIKINKPIFLVGNQGDGLTFVSRILRRNKQIVNVAGNNKYWAGADEMHRVYLQYLPDKLCFNHNNVSLDKLKNKLQYGWLYGSDDQINIFRSTSKDASLYLKRKLEKVIRYSVYRFSQSNNSRFIDKSQIYSVKLSLINELLKEYDPYFIYVTRNPYAAIYRMAQISTKNYKADFDYALDIHTQHWKNTYKSIKQDKEECKNFKKIKFEDFLSRNEALTKELCDFTKLEFNSNMLPSKYDNLPFGSKALKRWFPINPNVNDKYLDKIPKEVVVYLKDRIGNYANELGY